MEMRAETLHELDFEDDEPTIIRVRDEELNPPTPAPAPLLVVEASDLPALPFALNREKTRNDDVWLSALDPSARIILERATVVAPRWPIAPRIRGAVAIPTQGIPSLPARAS